MRICAIFLSFLLFISALALCPACADISMAATGATKSAEKAPAPKDQEADKAPEAAHEKAESNVFKCSYYTVRLPDNWRAVLPPEEREGLVNAIFARNTNSTVISMIIGPRAGADAKMIANMFAEQFKAKNPPQEKNGQYVFTFTQNDALEQKTLSSTSCVSVEGDEFMITTWSGNKKEAQNFLKNNIESESYSQLLPR